jgi:4-amino-4-deoxy-L-arabinose transferase-like glycosyltransferase
VTTRHSKAPLRSPSPSDEKAPSLDGLKYVLGLLSVLVGLALRLGYATHASRYIDEFATIWAGRQVLAQGLPRFPTGAIYTQGLFYTYLEAAALALGSASSPLQTRLPSLALSVLTLALLTYAARRLFHVLPVGFAALWLAVDAQAIIWGSRVRTYALLQFLVLAAFLAWYHGAVVGDRARHRWLAIGLLLVAMMDQPLILLLLPPLAILALMARGWGWLRQPVVWLQAVVVVVAVAARWLLYQMMIPTDAIVTAEPRTFLDLAHPFVPSNALASFFVDPSRLAPTLLLVGGVVWLLLRDRAGAPPWRKPVLSLAFVLAFVAMEMVLVVGTTWRHPRYLYPLLPFLFLGAEGVLVPALRGLSKRLPTISFRRALVALTVVTVLLSVLLAYRDARAAVMRDESGYDQAMAIVGDAWAEGDALATIAPIAAFVHLDDCDYLAIELEGLALTLNRNGRRIDGWTGLPLLDSPERLSEALETHPRLWFVADEMRLDRHFSSDFLQQLWNRTDLVAVERGVLVFRSRPATAPPAVTRILNADFDGQLRLESYSLSDDRPEAGETVTVTLRWATQAPDGEYTTFVHLVDREGEGIAGHDALPLDGLYPVARWPRLAKSQPLPDRHPLALPDDLPPGRYRLEVGIYRPGTMEPVGERMTLDFLSVGQEVAELPPGPALARFGNGATLYWLEMSGDFEPGGEASLQLAWQAGPAGFEDDYTIFLHLLDTEGHIAQQWDTPPSDGWYPTSFWRQGEVVTDDLSLDLSPMLAPGKYRLISGLYGAGGTRLALDNGDDFVELATIELKP